MHSLAVLTLPPLPRVVGRRVQMQQPRGGIGIFVSNLPAIQPVTSEPTATDAPSESPTSSQIYAPNNTEQPTTHTTETPSSALTEQQTQQAVNSSWPISQQGAHQAAKRKSTANNTVNQQPTTQSQCCVPSASTTQAPHTWFSSFSSGAKMESSFRCGK